MRSRLIYVLAAAVIALITAGAVSADDGRGGGDERRREQRRLRPDERARRQQDRRLPASRRRPVDRGRHLQNGRQRRERRAGDRVGPARLAGLARLRRATPAALRGERRQRHDLRVPRPRDAAGADRRRPVGGRLPGQHRRPRRPGLRAERRRRRHRPGLRDSRRPRPRTRRLGAFARARKHRPAELPHVARPGRLHAGRAAADRDHEGERQHDRRLPRAARRAPVGDGRREPVGNAGAVRVHVRSARPTGLGRGGNELGDDVHDQSQWDARERAVPERQPGRAVLDRRGARLLLRVEHGQQQPQRLPDRRQRPADADRLDGRRRDDRGGPDRPGHGGRRPVPLRPDGHRPEPWTSSA